MLVCIDDRERKRINKAREYFLENNCNVMVKELLYGDFVFKDNDISVAFEYKTIEDYIHSLKDYHVFNQAINQSNNFDYHFVIIVGTESERMKAISDNKRYTGRYMSLREYYGSFASIVNYSSILQVDNLNHAVILMLAVAEHCCSLKPVLKRFPKSRGSPALRLLSNNVAGIGYRTAELICDECCLESIVDVLTLTRDELVEVKGIGEKRADNILSQLGNL